MLQPQLADGYLKLLRNALTDTCGRFTTQHGPSGPTIGPLTPDHPRWIGKDWPFVAETMVGPRRLDSLRANIEHVISNGVQGDMIECGVWRGGASIFVRGVLNAHHDSRRLFLCDSFAGLPAPYLAQDAEMILHQIPYLAVSLKDVEENFVRYGLWSLTGLVFLKGWFKDTLPTLRGKNKWSLIRADGDMYSSTMEILENLYPDLQAGGVFICDDYHIVPECKKAIHEYRDAKKIGEPMIEIDGSAVYWIKY